MLYQSTSTMTKQSQVTKSRFAEQIAQSKTHEDPSHAENTMHWISMLKPDADEILLLAGFGHDVERSMPDRYTFAMFGDYDKYKLAHAQRSGQIAMRIVLDCGYSPEEGKRLRHIIAGHEFQSTDPEIQLICDADSISFFDNNAPYYLEDKGEEWTKKKMEFMNDSASERARQYISQVLSGKPELDLLNLSG
jgi:hypothetical protein